MRIVITGAGGFIGNALAESIIRDNDFEPLLLVDLKLPRKAKYDVLSNIRCVEGDYSDAQVRKDILHSGVELIYHLAALPGGAAEQNPSLSKQVNLNASLALFEELAAQPMMKKPKIIYASTIAVFGSAFPQQVDDSFMVCPETTYGSHKAMIELALSDMSRRGLVDAISLRLPGIIARPSGPSGLKSAFMSEVFHRLLADEPFVSPVSQNATMWLMSVARCIDNFRKAATVSFSNLPISRALTLPAVHCSMSQLCLEVAKQTQRPESLLNYKPEADLEASFGRYPPLVAAAAERAGFTDDGNLSELVGRVIESINTLSDGGEHE